MLLRQKRQDQNYDPAAPITSLCSKTTFEPTASSMKSTVGCIVYCPCPKSQLRREMAFCEFAKRSQDLEVSLSGCGLRAGLRGLSAMSAAAHMSVFVTSETPKASSSRTRIHSKFNKFRKLLGDSDKYIKCQKSSQKQNIKLGQSNE